MVKNTKKEFEKDRALKQQKLDFLEAQLSDARQQLNDVKKAHESTLSALEVSQIDSQSKQEASRQLLDLKEQHLREIKQLEAESESQKRKLTSQIEQLQKDISEVELKLSVVQSDRGGELQELKSQLEEASAVRAKMSVELKSLEDAKAKIAKECDDRYQARLRGLESEIEMLKIRTQAEGRDQQHKSEEALAQLKNFYELEKERLERRVMEEREKREKQYHTLVEEYEQRIRDEQGQYEEDLENLKEDLRDHEIQIQTLTSQYEHELDLKLKNIESLEKMLRETKDNLASTQTNFNMQMEQQITQFNAERTQLTARIEGLNAEIAKKEKELLSLS